MSLRRLFCRGLHPGLLTLDTAEAHHARTVLRLRPGDQVTLLNGRGASAPARIEALTKREVVVVAEAVEHHPFDAPRRVTLAVAMPRRHRQSYLVEKCTELGVAEICLMEVERQVSRPDGETVERLACRAAEALKQCGRFWLPDVTGPMPLSEVANSRKETDALAILHSSGEHVRLDQFLSSRAPLRPDRPPTVLFFIGPEGGWSQADVHEAVAAGAIPVSLGPIVLRTETAAIAACALANLGG